MKRQQAFMDDIPSPVDTNSGRLIPQFRVLKGSQNKAWATERAHVSWIARFIRFHDMRHPSRWVFVKLRCS